LKLYNSNVAPNPRRVRIFLAEKNIEVPLHNVDLGKLEQRQPNFAALNPFETIPALELDDGSVIAESMAICRYFEELQPEPNLFGRTPRERAEIEMWQRRLESQLFFPVAQAFRHSHPAMRDMESPQVQDWAEACKAKAHVAMRRFDAILKDRAFIAGERFSVADITGLVALDWTRPARIDVPDDLGALRRWREALSARPSAKA